VHSDPQTPSDPYDVVPEAGRPDRRPAIAALIVGGLALVVAVAIQPSIVEGGSGSVRAVLIASVLGLLFVGFVALAFRFVRQPVVLAALVGLPLLAMAAVLGYTALVDDEADDEVAQQLVTELADAEGEGDAVDPSAADEQADAAQDAPLPAGPVRLSTGTFQGLDDHAASGSVSLVEQPDGSQVVLFEDFEVERGPDYLVYLVPGDARFDASAGVEIAPLQGNVGDQQYTVPADLVGEQPLTVLIWCRAFDVNIAGASLV
jgi:hypothetical protein